MSYQIGDKIETKYGIGTIVNILEMRCNITCYETILEGTNKKKPIFWPEIIKKLQGDMTWEI